MTKKSTFSPKKAVVILIFCDRIIATHDRKEEKMHLIIYLLIVSCSAVQSAATKFSGKDGTSPIIFNAFKSSSALALFTILATVMGFRFHFSTVLLGAAYGVCLSLSMYTGYKALTLGPMALTSMLVSFSILLPVLWGFTVLDEKINYWQAIAFILLVFAIFMTNADKLKKGKKSERGYAIWLLFVFLTFIMNGTTSIIQKEHQLLYPGSYSREFMFFAMLVCTVVFSTVALIERRPKEIFKSRGKLLGIISGVTNGLTGFFTLILAGLENATVLFPIISAGTILAALLCGKFLFKEKLRLNHYLALLFGIFSVILMKL